MKRPGQNVTLIPKVLVHGLRWPQVGRVIMGQNLVDVTALRGRVALGGEVVLIGRQGEAVISADELAGRLGNHQL